MSIAPWWCGITAATKSASTSTDGLKSIATIILPVAALMSTGNRVSSDSTAGVVAYAGAAVMSATAISVATMRIAANSAGSGRDSQRGLRCTMPPRRAATAVPGTPVQLAAIHRLPVENPRGLLAYGTMVGADLGPNLTTVGSLATMLWLLILR